MKYSVSFLFPGPKGRLKEVAQFWNYGLAVEWKEAQKEFYSKHGVEIIIKDLLTQEEIT